MLETAGEHIHQSPSRYKDSKEQYTLGLFKNQEESHVARVEQVESSPR